MIYVLAFELFLLVGAIVVDVDWVKENANWILAACVAVIILTFLWEKRAYILSLIKSAQGRNGKGRTRMTRYSLDEAWSLAVTQKVMHPNDREIFHMTIEGESKANSLTVWSAPSGGIIIMPTAMPFAGMNGYIERDEFNRWLSSQQTGSLASEIIGSENVHEEGVVYEGYDRGSSVRNSQNVTRRNVKFRAKPGSGAREDK